MKDINTGRMKAYKSVDITIYVDVDLSCSAITNFGNYDERTLS